MTGASRELKNCCDDNMDYLPKSPASLERVNVPYEKDSTLIQTKDRK
jgi:hypothetical protein